MMDWLSQLSELKGESWWWALILSLLSGIIGAGLVEVRKWLRRPKLSISFSRYDLGLVVRHSLQSIWS
jgi:hypothetical protein